MKITLIKPNIGRREHSLYVDNASMEPLQLGILAALTPKDVEVVMYDDRLEPIPYDEDTDLVCITIETFTSRRSYEISEEFRKRGKKVIMESKGVICKFLIDEKLNITEIEENKNATTLEYEVLSRDGENIKILLTIANRESGLQQIEFPDGNIIYCNGNEEVAKDYEVQLGVEYKVKITSRDGQIKEETILIEDYYHKITKDLGEGVNIDNKAIKTAYNKPYQATITAGDEYKMNTITVTMAGQPVTVDNTTGIINI